MGGATTQECAKIFSKENLKTRVTVWAKASENGHLKNVEFLLNHPDMDVRYKNQGSEALVRAIKKVHLKIVKLLRKNLNNIHNYFQEFKNAKIPKMFMKFMHTIY